MRTTMATSTSSETGVTRLKRPCEASENPSSRWQFDIDTDGCHWQPCTPTPPNKGRPVAAPPPPGTWANKTWLLRASARQHMHMVSRTTGDVLAVCAGGRAQAAALAKTQFCGIMAEAGNSRHISVAPPGGGGGREVTHHSRRAAGVGETNRTPPLQRRVPFAR